MFLQQSSPSYHPVCPGDNVIITCNVSTGSAALRWKDPLNPSAISVLYTEMDVAGMDIVNLSIFEIKLVGRNLQNFEFSSEATVQNIQLSNNGSSLSCSDQIFVGNEKRVSISISGIYSLYYNTMQIHNDTLQEYQTVQVMFHLLLTLQLTSLFTGLHQLRILIVLLNIL